MIFVHSAEFRVLTPSLWPTTQVEVRTVHPFRPFHPATSAPTYVEASIPLFRSWGVFQILHPPTDESASLSKKIFHSLQSEP